MSDEFPKSRNVARYKTKDGKYAITAAAWDGSGLGESYEIGIRDLEARGFQLIQADWNEDQVSKAALAVTKLLDAGMCAYDIQEIFP